MKSLRRKSELLSTMLSFSIVYHQFYLPLSLPQWFISATFSPAVYHTFSASGPQYTLDPCLKCSNTSSHPTNDSFLRFNPNAFFSCLPNICTLHIFSLIVLFYICIISQHPKNSPPSKKKKKTL